MNEGREEMEGGKGKRICAQRSIKSSKKPA